jgi:AAA ATPase-like protein
MKLVIENVRCFAGKHEIPIRPLTILLGENSSGKTTLLAVLASMFNVAFPTRPQFNYPPYDLGNFDTIATYKAGGSGHARKFSIGYVQSLDGNSGLLEALATYRGSQGTARLLEFWLRQPDAEAHLWNGKSGEDVRARLALRYNGKTHVTQGELLRFSAAEYPYGNLFSDLLHLKGQTADAEWREHFREAFSVLLRGGALSIAPIRMKRRRTYDQFGEGYDPEGDRVPILLAGILAGKAKQKHRRTLTAALRHFGKESGLFNEIRIKRLGRKPGDPFQVLVSVGDGPASNLMDVGYGVSQSLPVIVESVLSNEGALLLVQQPEVDLHPKAQAALGSFFANVVAKSQKRMVVETHSDYIIDRIRQDVASGRIPPEDVVFLYLERKAGKTKFFPMTLDKLGNLNGAPPTYRKFFLREAMNLLMGAD